MRKNIWLVPVVLVIIACSGNQYPHTFSSSAILKDKYIASYEIKIDFESQKGIDEFIEHQDRIAHAIRIILVQRSSDQLESKARLWSVANKVLKSQLKEPFIKMTVESLTINK